LNTDKIIKFRNGKGMTEFHKIDSFRAVSEITGGKNIKIKPKYVIFPQLHQLVIIMMIKKFL